VKLNLAGRLTVWLLALIVMLDAPEAKLMLLPATRDTLLDDPFKLKFVAAAVAGP